MKDFYSKREKYFCNYADTISGVFRKIRYGVSECCPKKDLDLITMRYELAKWQSNLDYSLSMLIRLDTKWEAFMINGTPLTCLNVNITNNSAESYKFDPAASTWVINYNLPFTPNVTTTDLSGQEIQGTVQYITPSIIHIIFSSPVSGWAYLS
jgi:hypothetical protein